MTEDRHGLTTGAIAPLPIADERLEPTPGLVLVCSRFDESLPAAVPFVGRETTIGREPDNTLPIAESAVSRYHARIERKATGWMLIDNGSTNGTLVNGRRIERHTLVDHDVVRIGDTIFRYASAGAYRYAAYRPDGTVLAESRPTSHAVCDSTLVGGLRIDLVIDALAKVAPTALSVVVAGESGTGKELVAKEIHRLSGRTGPFQAINCAALPATLLESELFGYRKGAFTGASRDKTGLFKSAHRGTLFLDEIGDMPIEAQAKLLRTLQEREVLPIGATSPEPVDVRVVCATHRDLEADVEDGRFRGDLLGRLREFVVTLPPLRERREDIQRLTRSFLARHGRPKAEVTFPFMLALAHYDWPYNVRELDSAVKLAIALAGRATLDLKHLPDPVQHALDGHGSPAEERISTRPLSGRAPDEAMLRNLLERHGGNLAAVGRELGKERMQVHRWLRRYRIDPAEYRPREG